MLYYIMYLNNNNNIVINYICIYINTYTHIYTYKIAAVLCDNIFVIYLNGRKEKQKTEMHIKFIFSIFI